MPDYRCDYCQTNQADFMIGVIINGEQTAVCAPCLPKFANTIKRALADAAKAEQNAGVNEHPDYEAGEPVWEAGYPQGRDESTEAAAEAVTEVSGSDTTSPPASVE